MQNILSKHRLLSPCIDCASGSTGVLPELNSKVIPPQLAKDVANLRKSKAAAAAAASPRFARRHPISAAETMQRQCNAPRLRSADFRSLIHRLW